MPNTFFMLIIRSIYIYIFLTINRKNYLCCNLNSKCRYLQGARFFSDSNLEVDSVDDQPISDAAVVKNKTNPTDTTFRARFIGQGYKQVTPTTNLVF